MWAQEARDAYRLIMAFAESKLTELFEIVEEFISEYRFYILVGVIILVILVILDLLMKRQDKKDKKKINDQIEQQMKEEMRVDDPGGSASRGDYRQRN
jgi:hypothetical protein